MPAKRPEFSYPVPANKNGHAFSSAEALLCALVGESSGHYLVGSQGMWHGGIHITDATIPWCALSTDSEAEKAYRSQPYQGEQFIRCMADGEIVAFRVCRDYESAAIVWGDDSLHLSTSFVLVKHFVQPGENADSGLTFYTLYMNLAPYAAYAQREKPERKTKEIQRYYASAENAQAGSSAGSLLKDTRVMLSDNSITRHRDNRQFTEVTISGETKNAVGVTLAAGTRVWTVSDRGSLKSAESSVPAPSWWTKCAPASGQLLCGEVVKPAPTVAIKAGDSIGHMGFYQLPEEHGKRSRYQVHIECLSMDDMAKFITNPAGVGEQTPTFITYREGAALFARNSEGEWVDSRRKTRRQGLVTRSKVPVEEKDGQPAYYRIRKEGGWVAAADIRKVSQYALGERGFVTLDKAPESFDPTDGVKQPDNVVKGILEQLYKAAQNETRISHALNQYNYKRLLEQIDTNNDGHYSQEEYLQAIHNVSYRDCLYRLIARHGSEWYYGKDDSLWKNYLDTLTQAPRWKKYTEAFIDKMAWMKEVPGLGPEPWHMHPVVFLDALDDSDADEMDLKWLTVPKGQLTFNAEGNDIENSIYFSRHPHVPNNRGIVIGISGITFGRGLDLGKQSNSYIQSLLTEMEKNSKPLSTSLKKWLLGSLGKQGSIALTYCNEIDQHVPKNEQFLTRKQQYFLFNAIYAHQYSVTKRVLLKGIEIDNARITANLDSYDQSVQDVLVDLTFRGDNSTRTRRYFMSDLSGGRENFRTNISNPHWKNVFGVPVERFNARKGSL